METVVWFAFGNLCLHFRLSVILLDCTLRACAREGLVGLPRVSIKDRVDRMIESQWRTVRRGALRSASKLAEWEAANLERKIADPKRPYVEREREVDALEAFAAVLGPYREKLEELRPKYEAELRLVSPLEKLDKKVQAEVLKRRSYEESRKLGRKKLKPAEEPAEPVESEVIEPESPADDGEVPEHWRRAIKEVTRGDFSWALHHLGIGKPDKNDCPSAAAWVMWTAGRENPNWFMEKFAQHVLPKRDTDEAALRFEDDSEDILQELTDFERDFRRRVAKGLEVMV